MTIGDKQEKSMMKKTSAARKTVSKVLLSAGGWAWLLWPVAVGGCLE